MAARHRRDAARNKEYNVNKLVAATRGQPAKVTKVKTAPKKAPAKAAAKKAAPKKTKWAAPKTKKPATKAAPKTKKPAKKPAKAEKAADDEPVESVPEPTASTVKQEPLSPNVVVKRWPKVRDFRNVGPRAPTPKSRSESVGKTPSPKKATKSSVKAKSFGGRSPDEKTQKTVRVRTQ